jgi:Glycosyl-4,4'-diaponeurosporenoate acyltransferase
MERNRGIPVPGSSHLFTRLLLLIATTAVSGWLIIWAIGSFGFSSPITAFLLDWLVVACMATIALIIRLPLPSQYYEIKAYESSGRIYVLLGVPFFKKLVRRGPLSIFSRTFRLPKDESQTALLQLDQKMKGAEAIHVFSFLAIWPVICFSILWKWLDGAAWLLLFNLMVNG